MKLFTKIFLCTVAVITFALSVMGFLMISESFKNAFARENQRALEEYQLLKFTLQSGMLSAAQSKSLTEESLLSLARQTADVAPSGNQTAIFSGDEKQLIHSTFPADYAFTSLLSADRDGIIYETENRGGNHWLIVTGGFEQSGEIIYLSTARNISAVIAEKKALQTRFAIVYAIVLLVSSMIMLLLSLVLTNPIKRLTRSTRRIASGRYAERVNITTLDEIGELSLRFNRMANTVEETIRQLELNAQQKEDFVANFAHELKTPLTSVIGYADMIYQKDLSKREVKEAAGYIVNEGLRLEALSIKLLELIVLDKQDFTLMEMPADELLKDVAETLRPLMEQKHIDLYLTPEPAYIRIEFDLFKTLLLNLADNASKADSTRINISGRIAGESYIITVADDGRGIPEDQLSRITEAFYMVDKSRSRKQHGAGLGLAIAAKIAKLHATVLEYQSEVGKGTSVRIALPMSGYEP